MPALLEITAEARPEQPRGLLGVPVHGAVFDALESHSGSLSTRLHEAQVKAFRIGGTEWETAAQEGEPAHVRFQLGILDDDLIGDFLQALRPGVRLGHAGDTLCGEVLDCRLLKHESYEALYTRHAGEVTGRQLHFSLLTPATFRTTDMDSPFPVPKTVFFGLQRRWEAFCGLQMGEELNDWIGRSVRVENYRLFPRNVAFKGQRGSRAKASVGEVTFQIARPGDGGPVFTRLLTEYASYSGIGYKTTYGLGHVETAIESGI